MGYCRIHWESYEPECEKCRAMYREDMAARPPLIPPRFVEEGIDFTFKDWRAVHLAETEGEAKALSTREYHAATTDEEREAIIKSFCKEAATKAIDRCIRDRRVEHKSPGQIIAEKNARIRKRYTY